MRFSKWVVMVWMLLGLQLAATQAWARSSVPVVDHDNIEVVPGSGQKPSLEQMQKTLAVAGRARGWVLKPVGPGKMLGTLNVRGKHTIVVDVTYKPGSYSIAYKDSVNMNAEQRDGAQLIHPKYNAWVDTFMQDVQTAFLVL